VVELSPRRRNAGSFHWVHAIAVDAKGNVLYAEVDTGKRVQKSIDLGRAAIALPARRERFFYRQERRSACRSNYRSGLREKSQRQQSGGSNMRTHCSRCVYARTSRLAGLGIWRDQPRRPEDPKRSDSGVIEPTCRALCPTSGRPNSIVRGSDGGRDSGLTKKGLGKSDVVSGDAPKSGCRCQHHTAVDRHRQGRRGSPIRPIPGGAGRQQHLKEKNAVLLNIRPPTADSPARLHPEHRVVHPTTHYMWANGTGNGADQVPASQTSWFLSPPIMPSAPALRCADTTR